MMLATGKHFFTFVLALGTHSSFSQNRSGLSWRVNVIAVVEFNVLHGLIIGKFVTHCVVKFLQIQFKLICLRKFICSISIIGDVIKRLNHILIDFNLFGTSMTKILKQTIISQLKIKIVLLTPRAIIIKTLCSDSW